VVVDAVRGEPVSGVFMAGSPDKQGIYREIIQILDNFRNLAVTENWLFGLFYPNSLIKEQGIYLI
jgi:hypothetical protein